MSGSRILSQNEVQTILGYLKRTNQRNYTAVLCSVHFGLRISELLFLRWSDVSGDYLYIRSLKGSKNQTFPIPKNVQRELKNLKRYYQEKDINITDDHFVVLSQVGENKPLSRQYFNRILRNTCKTLSITGKISNHSFRKTFINEIFKKTGKDVFKTRTYSRHRSISSLSAYVEGSHDTTLVNILNWE